MFFFSSRRRHTRWNCDWSSDVCSSDLIVREPAKRRYLGLGEDVEIVTGLWRAVRSDGSREHNDAAIGVGGRRDRSEERRVGKEWRTRWPRWHSKDKKSKQVGGSTQRSR